MVFVNLLYYNYLNPLNVSNDSCSDQMDKKKEEKSHFSVAKTILLS